MDQVSPEEIERLARLSRLPLTAEQRTAFAGQLTGILRFVAKLQAVETDGIAPTHHVTEGDAVLRGDVAADVSAETREALLGAMPQRDGDGLSVPTVLP